MNGDKRNEKTLWQKINFLNLGIMHFIGFGGLFFVAIILDMCFSGYFTINLINADTFVKFDYKGLDSFVAFMCVEGSAVFTSQRKCNGKISAGETILFPACDLPVALIPENDKVKLLEVYVR